MLKISQNVVVNLKDFPNKFNPKRFSTCHSIIKLAKGKEKRIIKAATETCQVIYKIIHIRLSVDFSSETLQVRKKIGWYIQSARRIKTNERKLSKHTRDITSLPTNKCWSNLSPLYLPYKKYLREFLKWERKYSNYQHKNVEVKEKKLLMNVNIWSKPNYLNVLREWYICLVIR